MTLSQSLVLGVIEGLTEFLPVSSTAHITLVSDLMKVADTPLFMTFLLTVQMGAIGAVIFLYIKKLCDVKLWKNLIIAFIPTGVAGLLVYKHIKQFLGSPLLIAYMLIVGGIIMIGSEIWYGKKLHDGDISERHSLSLRHSFILGCIQCFAMIPGVSRSGSVIVGGLLMKLPRALLTEFTFLLAIPTMTIATLYTIHKESHNLVFSHDIVPLVVGTLTSFFVALGVIKVFINYIRKHTFIPFGIYRIIIGIVALAIFF